MLKVYKPVRSEAWSDPNPNKLKLDWNEGNAFLGSIIHQINHFMSSGNISFYPDIDESEILNSLSNYTGLGSDQLLLVPGSDYGHEVILKFLRHKLNGKSVLIPTPTYDNFRSTSETILDSVKCLQLGIKNYHEWFEQNLDGFDALYISNPNNPSGDFIQKEQLEILLKKHKNKLFIVDEAYIDFDLEKSVVELVLKHKNLVVSRTFSKAFGLAAFRVGYLLSHFNTMENLRRYSNLKHVNAFAKIAVKEVLDNLPFFQQCNLLVKENRKKLIEKLMARGDVKKCYSGGGNFILVQLEDSRIFIDCLHEHSIYIRNLAHLEGLDNHVRVTIPVFGIDRLKEAL